jgi:methionyl aminopeptidase
MLPTGTIVELKDNQWLEKQKFAGNVLNNIHREFFQMFKGKTQGLTLSFLNKIAHQMIEEQKCVPTFLNYNGFPTTICASVNQELVHGFANRDFELKEGDVVKIDLGVTYESAIADCAVTFIYGKPKNDNIFKLLLSCQNALYKAVEKFKPGNRIGELGNAIYKQAQQDNFGVIIEYGGHGINYNTLHAEPFISNKSSVNEGVRIQPGMSIAIEPLFVLGKNTKTKIINNKWTVITKEINAHFEHSVTLDSQGNQHIITDHGIFVKDFV